MPTFEQDGALVPVKQQNNNNHRTRSSTKSRSPGKWAEQRQRVLSRSRSGNNQEGVLNGNKSTLTRASLPSTSRTPRNADHSNNNIKHHNNDRSPNRTVVRIPTHNHKNDHNSPNQQQSTSDHRGNSSRGSEDDASQSSNSTIQISDNDEDRREPFHLQTPSGDPTSSKRINLSTAISRLVITRSPQTPSSEPGTMTSGDKHPRRRRMKYHPTASNIKGQTDNNNGHRMVQSERLRRSVDNDIFQVTPSSGNISTWEMRQRFQREFPGETVPIDVVLRHLYKDEQVVESERRERYKSDFPGEPLPSDEVLKKLYASQSLDGTQGATSGGPFPQSHMSLKRLVEKSAALPASSTHSGTTWVTPDFSKDLDQSPPSSYHGETDKPSMLPPRKSSIDYHDRDTFHESIDSIMEASVEDGIELPTSAFMQNSSSFSSSVGKIDIPSSNRKKSASFSQNRRKDAVQASRNAIGVLAEELFVKPPHSDMMKNSSSFSSLEKMEKLSSSRRKKTSSSQDRQHDSFQESHESIGAFDDEGIFKAASGKSSKNHLGAKKKSSKPRPSRERSVERTRKSADTNEHRDRSVERSRKSDEANKIRDKSLEITKKSADNDRSHARSVETTKLVDHDKNRERSVERARKSDTGRTHTRSGDKNKQPDRDKNHDRGSRKSDTKNVRDRSVERLKKSDTDRPRDRSFERTKKSDKPSATKKKSTERHGDVSPTVEGSRSLRGSRMTGGGDAAWKLREKWKADSRTKSAPVTPALAKPIGRDLPTNSKPAVEKSRGTMRTKSLDNMEVLGTKFAGNPFTSNVSQPKPNRKMKIEADVQLQRSFSGDPFSTILPPQSPPHNETFDAFGMAQDPCALANEAFNAFGKQETYFSPAVQDDLFQTGTTAISKIGTNSFEELGTSFTPYDSCASLDNPAKVSGKVSGSNLKNNREKVRVPPIRSRSGQEDTRTAPMRTRSGTLPGTNAGAVPLTPGMLRPPTKDSRSKHAERLKSPGWGIEIPGALLQQVGGDVDSGDDVDANEISIHLNREEVPLSPITVATKKAVGRPMRRRGRY